jgi:hypothetical protein
MTSLVIVGVPLLTFLVAAPTRVGLFRELGLFLRGLEASALAALLVVLGRRRDVPAVIGRQRARVEMAYGASPDRVGAIVADDPLRLHHARRLASFGAFLVVLAGMGLPLTQPETYTFGDFPQAPLVFGLDLLTLALVGRVVSERLAVRLLEAAHTMGGGSPWFARARVVPLTSMLGAALGSVASLIVIGAAGAASSFETSWVVSDVGFIRPFFWFVGQTAPLGLPLGIAIGGILGAGIGLAQPREKTEALVEL